MKRYLVFPIAIILVVSFTIPSCTNDDSQAKVDILIQEAKQTLAPDRRTVVFDVTGRLERENIILSGEVHSVELKDKLLEFIGANNEYPVVDSLTALPHPILGDKTFAVVSLSVANLRTKPSHAAEMATQAVLGMPLRVLNKERGWYYVQTPDDYLGWTSDMIELMANDEFEQWRQQPKLIVKTSHGFTYQTPNRNGPVVSDVVVGSILGLRKQAGLYYEVIYPDGRKAYLRKDEGEPLDRWIASVRGTPERILTTAKRFMGVPYLWGGTSAKGLDCSGFTKTVFYLNGVLLPRDANQQAKVGVPIEISDKNNLLPGDLLFFGSRASADKPERITHCAISLGGYRYIHEAGDVRTNSFNPNDPDYSESRENSFLAARRIIGAGDSVGIIKLSQLPYYRQ